MNNYEIIKNKIIKNEILKHKIIKNEIIKNEIIKNEILKNNNLILILILIKFTTSNKFELQINLNTIYLLTNDSKLNKEFIKNDEKIISKEIISKEEQSLSNPKELVTPDDKIYYKILLNNISNPNISSKKYISNKAFLELTDEELKDNIKVYNDDIYITNEFFGKYYIIDTIANDDDPMFRNKYIEYKTKYLIFKNFISKP